MDVPYRAALRTIGNAGCQEMGRWLNNRAENSHPPSGDASGQFNALKRKEAFLPHGNQYRSCDNRAGPRAGAQTGYPADR
jgi:hypothetical protein